MDFSTSYADEDSRLPLYWKTISEGHVLGAPFDLGKFQERWRRLVSEVGARITIKFARKVGEILSYIPENEEPHPSYRFYM